MTDDLDLHCSVLTRRLGENPTGTAGSWHRLILAELPLPWPHAIEDHPLLVGIQDQASGRSHRVLALASALLPEQVSPDDGYRVICYWRPPGTPFARFARVEVCAPEGDVAEIISHLIEADDDTLSAMPDNAFAAGPAIVDHPVRDLLICTHGTRDRCCGKKGTDVFRSLTESVPPGVRLWRTSHTGGHRFAPTGLTFPDGGTWAGLDPDLALGLIGRTVPAAVAAEHARGSAGVPSGPAQVADAAGLAELGWTWCDQERAFTVDRGGSDGDEVGERVAVTINAGGHTYRAVVEAKREVPVPDCGNPLEAARKFTLEWSLVSFEQE